MRVSRSLLGTAKPEGSPAKLTRFFRLRERAARATGRGRGRDSRPAGPRSIPRRATRAAPRLATRGRRENAPPVEKNYPDLIPYSNTSKYYSSMKEDWGSSRQGPVLAGILVTLADCECCCDGGRQEQKQLDVQRWVCSVGLGSRLSTIDRDLPDLI